MAGINLWPTVVVNSLPWGSKTQCGLYGESVEVSSPILSVSYLCWLKWAQFVCSHRVVLQGFLSCSDRPLVSADHVCEGLLVYGTSDIFQISSQSWIMTSPSFLYLYIDLSSLLPGLIWISDSMPFPDTMQSFSVVNLSRDWKHIFI